MMPENTLPADATASAMPSITPSVATDAPMVPQRKAGKRLCTNSDEVSMNSDTKPSAQMPPGSAR